MAGWCLDRHIHPIPVPHREKAPRLKGWPDLELSREQLPKYFSGQMNIGAKLGPAGLTDVDLDCIEAVRAAPELLPATGVIFGRASKPASHYFFFSAPPVPLFQYRDPLAGNDEKGMLVEFRCTKKDGGCGLQTILPTSVHRDSGEVIRFENGFTGQPANIDAAGLRRAVSRVAAASLLARYWAPAGSRNTAFLALAGALVRAGWALEDVIAFHRAIYRALWPEDPNLTACAAEVTATFEKLAHGTPATGARTLEEFIAPRVVGPVFAWLGIGEAIAPDTGSVQVSGPTMHPALAIGKPFDPRPQKCGFNAADIVDACRLKRPPRDPCNNPPRSVPPIVASVSSDRRRTRKPPGSDIKPLLNDGMKRVYRKLWLYAQKHGTAYPGQGTIADELGMSRETVNAHLKALKALDLLRWKRTNDSNEYDFIFREIFHLDVNTWLHPEQTNGQKQKETFHV